MKASPHRPMLPQTVWPSARTFRKRTFPRSRANRRAPLNGVAGSYVAAATSAVFALSGMRNGPKNASRSRMAIERIVHRDVAEVEVKVVELAPRLVALA